jgi:hypothetical protein
MKKTILWLLISAILIAIVYLATLSDPSLDESVRLVEIDSYLAKVEMIDDIDSLVSIFDRVHPNPYRFTEKNHLLSKIDSIKIKLPDSLTIMNFWRVLDEIIVTYNDAHSTAEDRYVLSDYVKKDRLFFPLTASIQNNRIFVSKHDSLGQVLPEGVEIKKINGKSGKEIVKDLLKHATKETQDLKRQEISDDFGFYLWKTYDWGAKFTIHYTSIDTANVDSIVVEGEKWESRARPVQSETDSYHFKLLEDKVGLMTIADFNGDEQAIKDFYEESFKLLAESNSSHLILDFRGHIGGADSYGEHLAKYFAKVPYRKLSKAYWKITPDFKEAFDRRFVPKGIRWFRPIYLINEYSSVFYGAKQNELVTVNYELKDPLPKDERFLGNVYLITDHNTFSAGSIFAEMFKYYNMGKIIGQPTGNLCSFNGFALANFTLPNSRLSFRVSSVYSIANNKEEGLQSVEPDDKISLESDPLDYIFKTYIR